MSVFNEKTNQIELDHDDLRHEKPKIVTNFWEVIMGKPRIEDTIPKPRKVNLIN